MVREVSPDAVADRIADGADVTVVDIRPQDEFAEGHVPGAINLPLPELPRRVDEREWDAEEVVCVCHLGESSVQAARLLSSYEDIDADAVASMAGGYQEWEGDLETGRDDRSGADDADADDGSAADEGPNAPF